MSLAFTPIAVSAAEDDGSVYVQCDGQPNKASALGTVARLIAITAIIGLFLPPEETADGSKRKTGAEGVAACNAALNGDEQAKDGVRRIELFLGRAIHQMEQENWDAAIADLRAAEADQPDLIATDVYKSSLGQTALFLEAMALTGKKDFPAARAKALEVAERTPYDLRFLLSAIDFTRMVPTWDDQTSAYYDQFVRVYPAGLSARASAKAIAGDMRGAAIDYLHLRDLNDTMPKWALYGEESLAALGLALAGERAQADPLMSKAVAGADADRGEANRSEIRSRVAQANDFMGILNRLEAGETDIARTLFAARSEWQHIPFGFVMELAHRIDTASSDELKARMPMKTRDEFLQDQLERSRTLVTDTGEGSRDRWSLFRQPTEPKVFKKFARNTWRADKSKYFAKEPAENWNGTLVNVSRNGDGIAGAYALYLHAALVAKERGKEHFMVLPNQRALFAHYVRLGDPGDTDIVTPLLFNAEEVIADLSPYIPQPTKRR